jgi:hypothetical protein
LSFQDDAMGTYSHPDPPPLAGEGRAGVDELGVGALLIGRSAQCRISPAARGSCGAEGDYNGYCDPEIEAVYGCTCCSRGLTSSKSITPFQ